MNEFLETIKIEKMWEAVQETLYMTAISVVATFILGLLLGLVLS